MWKCASVCVSCMSVDAHIFACIFACFYLYLCARVCVRMCMHFHSAPEGGSATLKPTEGTHRGLTSVFGEIKQSVFIVRCWCSS